MRISFSCVSKIVVSKQSSLEVLHIHAHKHTHMCTHSHKYIHTDTNTYTHTNIYKQIHS